MIQNPQSGRTVEEAYQKFQQRYDQYHGNPVPSAENMKIHGKLENIIDNRKQEGL